MGTIVPDEETLQRIKNLSQVGRALVEIHSENAYSTNFFLAKEALNNFLERIKKLNLDENTLKGIEDLVSYLSKKIDRRMINADSERQSPIIS